MSFRRMQESMSFHYSDARGAVGGRVGAGSKQINVLRCHTYTKPYGYWLQRRSPTSRVSDGYGVGGTTRRCQLTACIRAM